MKKTYTGSCHCKKIRFEADIDLAAGTGKCNCSICTKKRAWEAMVKPEAFRLLAGESALTDYQFGAKKCHHVFCKHCGMHPYAHGNVPEVGGAFISVSLGALDDLDPAELIDAPVKFYNGSDDDWMNQPAETRHL